jgi:hypothetical protein
MALRNLGRGFMYNVNYNTFVPSTPSSYEMRYKTFLGSMHQRTQKMRKQRGNNMESGEYEWEWYDHPSRKPPSRKPFP